MKSLLYIVLFVLISFVSSGCSTMGWIKTPYIYEGKKNLVIDATLDGNIFNKRNAFIFVGKVDNSCNVTSLGGVELSNGINLIAVPSDKRLVFEIKYTKNANHKTVSHASYSDMTMALIKQGHNGRIKASIENGFYYTQYYDKDLATNKTIEYKALPLSSCKPMK